MNLYELFLISIGLSMDAFAVSLCKGLEMKRINYRHSVIIALFFGIFQAAMPLAGWLLGKQFEKHITRYDHWIAFALLLYIGGKMLKDAFTMKDDENSTACDDTFSIKELILLSVATSIDALAVGITFAFFAVSILPAVLLIGSVTTVLCFIGVVLGNRFGSVYKRKAQVIGGVILVFIGVKILFNHLGIS